MSRFAPMRFSPQPKVLVLCHKRDCKKSWSESNTEKVGVACMPVVLENTKRNNNLKHKSYHTATLQYAIFETEKTENWPKMSKPRGPTPSLGAQQKDKTMIHSSSIERINHWLTVALFNCSIQTYP
mmetsp:Transcript_26893/g.40174  ORF Transcript_26893/g.40174 Transcript_26893/m.40174 type:complete len:126 (+) Transcript_26893:730-1107(+)